MATGIIPPYTPPPEWVAEETSGALGALGLLLVLRAFSSGAVALTGVEAVSDGVPAFKPPEWRNARTTLTWAAGLFAVLFVGISLLVSILGIIPDPSEDQTVLYLLTRHITGDGPYLIFVQVSTALILTLAANTSFADFPRLSSFLARDGFMPRQFGFRGDRLAFSTGIIALAGLAIVLLIGFGASVSALIPLYTLGVFVAFTLSQSGMVRRWWHRREPGWRRGLAINGLGAVTTGVIVLVVATSKFTSGAWLVMILVPLLVLLMWAIHVHYQRLELAVAPRSSRARQRAGSLAAGDRADRAPRPAHHWTPSPSRARSPRTRWRCTSPTMRGTRPSCASHWAELGGGAELVIVESPYRALIKPLLRYLDALQRQDPDRRLLVVLSEVVPKPLVGQLPAQPDRAASQAAPLLPAEHDRGGRAVPRAGGVGMGADSLRPMSRRARPSGTSEPVAPANPQASARPSKPSEPPIEVQELRERTERRGRLPGDRYVKVIEPFGEQFRRRASGHLIASEQVLRPVGMAGRTADMVRRVLIGQRIPTGKRGPRAHRAYQRACHLRLGQHLVIRLRHRGDHARPGPGRGRRPGADAAAHGRDRGGAGDRGDQLPADDPRLPQRRRLVHRGQRQPGRGPGWWRPPPC